jgi:hypothetical protein
VFTSDVICSFVEKGDVAAARRLFMRGLRISNQSKGADNV